MAMHALLRINGDRAPYCTYKSLIPGSNLGPGASSQGGLRGLAVLSVVAIPMVGCKLPGLNRGLLELEPTFFSWAITGLEIRSFAHSLFALLLKIALVALYKWAICFFSRVNRDMLEKPKSEFPTLAIWCRNQWTEHPGAYRRRIKTEEKGKVVTVA